ncbi:3-oxoacyl-ACP synthase [Streptomyces griseocarneus]|nr:3-oxoacyl-ACP synthase [Streptomyces griseocarneus]
MTSTAVAVTGVGLLTPAGIGSRDTFDAMCSGRSTAEVDPDLKGASVDISCAVPDFRAPELIGRRRTHRMDRFTQLAVVAAREAVDDAGLSTGEWLPERVGAVFGTATSSMETLAVETGHYLDGRPDRISPMSLTRSLPSAPLTEVTLDLGIRGPSLALSTACAAGNQALALGADLLRSGACDIVVAGGSENPRTLPCALLLDKLRALSRRHDLPECASRPFDADRDGLVIGEGAGVLVLERLDHARARGAAPRALLAGHGSTSDAHHYVAPDPEGHGAEAAMRAALTNAGLGPADIDHVNAHATATPAGDLAEARALRRLFPDGAPPVTAPKSVIGHSLGAAGAVESALTVLTLQHQRIPPTANLDMLDPAIDLDVVHGRPRDVRMRAALSNSFAFGGHNTVLVFTTA